MGSEKIRTEEPGPSYGTPPEPADAGLLRQILNVSTDFIFTKDACCRYTYVNQAMADLFGCRPEDLTGKTPADLFDPEHARVVDEVDRKALSGKVADEVRMIHIGDSEYCFHTVQGPLREADGSICGICGIVRDITERRKAETALKEQHRQLLSIFEGIDEVVYVADPDTYELLYMNAPAMNNWGDRIGEKCYAALQDRDSPCPFCSNHLIFGELLGKTHIWEFRNLHNDRTYRCIDRAITWTDGRLVRFELALDITDLREAEQRRIELERQVQHTQKLESLGVLAGGIAHDFNNILMAVLGNVDIALRDISPANPAYVNLKEIELAARRAADLSRQMLAYSGRGQFKVERISINEVVTEITHILEVSISKRST